MGDLILRLSEDREEKVVVGDKEICVACGEGECFGLVVVGPVGDIGVEDGVWRGECDDV